MSGSDEDHTTDEHPIDERLADLADVIQALARRITTDAHADPGVVALTHTEINVMRFVDRHPGTSPATVAVAVGLQRSNLSRTLRDLEAKGLIEKTSHGDDGRQTQLNPTRRAGANLERLRGIWSRILGSADADLRNLDATLALLADLEVGLTADR